MGTMPMNEDHNAPISRRNLLKGAAAAASGLALTAARGEDGLDNAWPGLASIKRAPGWVVDAATGRPTNAVHLRRSWAGGICRTEVANTGAAPVRIHEVVLLSVRHGLTADTRLYGEGFTMLSQTGGTMAAPHPIGDLTDERHYRIPKPADALACYGMVLLSPPTGANLLMGFTSCRRFVGKFYVRPESVDVVVDTEGLQLAPGESWQLEELLVGTGADRQALLSLLAARMRRNHRPLLTKSPPTGWCSWYTFGPGVTAEDVARNLEFAARELPELRYVQIDDGYQPAMGDWLEAGRAFGGDVRSVLGQICDRGFQPAIWVAPFIAEQGSRLAKEHPDWFIMDADGHPLPSDRVTFGGWRRGPWYALDGTHPQVQRHLEGLFRTLRQEWGCTYFKLDANFWGAMHGGRFHDPKATRVEAYRRGMEAILRGAGDAFILGCNHPLWPSLGLIHGSRSSGDIGRSWDRFARTARENLSRNWQSGKLWWNDPDCVLLTGSLPENELLFHATAIYATGGMVLSGDDMPQIAPERLRLLRKLLPPTGVPARFEDEGLEVGRIPLRGRMHVCLLNWGDAPRSLSFRLDGRSLVSDYWTGQDLGRHTGTFAVEEMPPRSAKLLVVRPERA